MVGGVSKCVGMSRSYPGDTRGYLEDTSRCPGYNPETIPDTLYTGSKVATVYVGIVIRW